MPKHIEIPLRRSWPASYLAGMSTPALALYYGCSAATIAKRLRWLRRCLRSARFTAITIPEAGAAPPLSQEERQSIAEIAAFFGVSSSTVGNKRRAYGIPSRAYLRVLGDELKRLTTTPRSAQVRLSL